MTGDAKKQLETALREMADKILATPVHVTGMSVRVAAGGPGSGPVTGVSVTLNLNGEVKGDVAALKVSANASAVAEIHGLAAELRDAADAVREGTAKKSWLKGLLDRAGNVAGHAINAAMIHGAVKLLDAAF